MQLLLVFLVVMIVAVGAAEFVRASCLRQLAAPVRVRVQPLQREGVLVD